jgi:serine phosphatase RsbU (regulator of sigma subunit)
LLRAGSIDHRRGWFCESIPEGEGFIQSVDEGPAIFSNVRANIEDQAAEGDKVITRLTLSRIHDRGAFLGLAPTGMEIKTSAIVIHRLAGGKIVEEWSESTGALEATRRRLEQQMIEHERAHQELQVARRIQQASLPKEVPKLAGWQINPCFRPAREVRGDFYEFFDLRDGRLGFAVGDATGKGVPAAQVMTATCAFLGGVATASGSFSPGEVLARVNDAVLTRIPPNMFVTCFYGVLDPKSGHFSYANTGHNLPCCCREHAATDLRAKGMPLGLMPGMRYEENETVLAPGECVLFYADGATEAHNPEGEMFGTPRLRSLLAEYSTDGRGLDAPLLEKAVLDELRSFVGESWEQEDDITLLTLERSGTRS